MKRYTTFSSASVSMMLWGEDAPLYALDGGIMQKGSSGGPVFTSDGSIVGIIVQSWQFPVDLGHPQFRIETLPVMSALYHSADLIDDIQKEAGLSIGE